MSKLDPRALEDAAFEIFLLDDDGERESEARRWVTCRDQPHKGDCSLAEPQHQGPVSCSRCVYDNCVERARQIITAYLSSSPEAEPVATLQARVQPWMLACFGPEISADRLERSDRFAEEALELLQSVGHPRERVLALVDYVYSREAGEPSQEVGGVMITLAALCLAHDLDMHAAGETELARIWTKIEKIRAKQAAKPVGSALPIAAPVALDALRRELSVTKEISAGWQRLANAMCHERDEALSAIRRLRGTLEYIAAQAKQDYPTVLSVIRVNAAAALDDDWQATVSHLSRKDTDNE